MNIHNMKCFVVLGILLFLYGCVSDRMFVVKDKIFATNVANGWEVEVLADSAIDRFQAKSIFCNVCIKYPRFFKYGLNVCAEFALHGPFDMKTFGAIERNSVRSHYVFIGKCNMSNSSIKVYVCIAQEDFASFESLNNYFKESVRRIGHENISFSKDGIFCRIFPYRDGTEIGAELSKVTIKGCPLSDVEYSSLDVANRTL